MDTNIIYVNDKQVTEEELKALKESVTKNKDVQLVEISPNKYKTRLFG
jgi:hypothetical protein